MHVRSEGFDFEDGEVAIHHTRDMHQQVRLSVIEMLPSNEGMASLINLSPERIDPFNWPSFPELVI